MALVAAFADEREAIEETFLNAWNALSAPSGPAPIEMDNVRFEATQVQGINWGRFTIIDGDAFQVGLGTHPCWRGEGQIVLQLFAPEKTGTASVRVLADQFLEIWRDAFGRPLELSKGNSGRIRTQLGRVVRDGIVDGWFQLRAIVPYTRDVVAT